MKINVLMTDPCKTGGNPPKSKEVEYPRISTKELNAFLYHGKESATIYRIRKASGLSYSRMKTFLAESV